MKNKDVLYIDIDDDITSVIDKVKSSSSPIVALVTPKRSGVFQSIVNLKLLQRKAETASKRLVFVTSDRATVALAGSLGLYVAKNLQTKPEIPTVGSVLATPADEIEAIEPPEASTTDITDDDLLKADLAQATTAIPIHDNSAEASVASAKKPKDKKPKKKAKIPNFDGFRKKALLIGGGLILLIIVLVAFLTLTGKTTVTIHGETSSVDVAFALKIDANADKTSTKDNIIKATSQELQKSVSQTFTASGEKNIGKTASGSVEMVACAENPSQVSSVPAGSTVVANGLKFVTKQNANFSFSFDSCDGGGFKFESNSVDIAATQPGDNYNISSDSYSVSGRGNVSASGSASGGTSQIVKIITQADVDGAKAKLQKQNKSDIQKELAGQFDKDLRILDDTFISTAGQINVTPNVGDQASQGTVTAQYTYTMLAISNDDLNTVLDHYVNSTIEDKSTQRIYKNGFDNLTLTAASKPSPSTMSYNVKATGYVGPQFDEDAIKNQITGKKYGQIVSTLQQIKGVSAVDVDFKPFWSHSAGPPSRIQIKLDVSKTSDNGS